MDMSTARAHCLNFSHFRLMKSIMENEIHYPYIVNYVKSSPFGCWPIIGYFLRRQQPRRKKGFFVSAIVLIFYGVVDVYNLIFPLFEKKSEVTVSLNNNLIFIQLIAIYSLGKSTKLFPDSKPCNICLAAQITLLFTCLSDYSSFWNV